MGVEAEGDRVLTREEIVELADAVAAGAASPPASAPAGYGAQLVVEAATTATRRSSGPPAEFAGGRGARRPAAVAGRPAIERDQRGRRRPRRGAG